MKEIAMTHEDLENIYENIAEAIDYVGQEKTEVYLAKLCLSLAVLCNDTDLVLQKIIHCRDDT